MTDFCNPQKQVAIRKYSEETVSNACKKLRNLFMKMCLNLLCYLSHIYLIDEWHNMESKSYILPAFFKNIAENSQSYQCNCPEHLVIF